MKSIARLTIDVCSDIAPGLLNDVNIYHIEASFIDLNGVKHDLTVEDFEVLAVEEF